jgi:hypothetical protein
MERWLYQNISKYSDDTNKDLADRLFNELLLFLEKSEDIYLEADRRTFRILFYNLIYSKYS